MTARVCFSKDALRDHASTTSITVEARGSAALIVEHKIRRTSRSSRL
jgi:hypothetical protein